jgi:hypothetical protein
MSTYKTTKSLNGLVFEIAYKRLKLSGVERSVFYKLLGFLIRNDKPFPYSAMKLSEITGFHRTTVFDALNKLEKYRLIERIGLTSNRKFKRGRILSRILTLVGNRIKREQYKSSTLVGVPYQKLNTSRGGLYKKTSLSLKHKEGSCSFPLETQLQYNNYIQDKKALKRLKLLPEDDLILPIEEWSLSES